MAVRVDKETGDLIFDGWQQGIGTSPHNGVANLQAVDINTELNEVMCSYSRFQQSQVSGSGTLTNVNGNTVAFSATSPLNMVVVAGSWITVSGGGAWGLADGNYFVYFSDGSGNLRLSPTYTITGSTIVTGMTAGTATFTTAFPMNLPIQGATERYVDTSGVTQFRYYIVDVFGRLWVYDTALVAKWNWFLPFTDTITQYNNGVATSASGMTVMNGYVFIFGGNNVFTVSTSRLGTAPVFLSLGNINGSLLSKANTTNPHFAFAGHQGRLYYTDGRFVGSIFPDTSIDPNLSVPITNVQSYASYTAVTTTGTITAILNGSFPTQTTTGTPVRIPAYFLPAYLGTLPTALTLGTKYYIQYTPAGGVATFQVYAAQTGGAPLDIQSGSVGIQYFNTFYPESVGGNDTYTFSPERLILPSDEISTTIAELGLTLIIGTQSNILYTWNQIDATYTDFLPMPERGTASMVTVNNVVYIFAGFRGNIYVTNASSVSLAMTVPDYCTGLIEPYFLWGGSMFLRGRVYFSIQDQTATHTGNCGGVWSFIPVQNFYVSEDIGMALRMDNENSYGTFNGRVTVFLPDYNQLARGPQYWSAWISNITTPTYGIDYSDTVPRIPAVIQTDVAPTGTMLQKKTFSQIEYKLAVPLASSDTVSMAYRLNINDPFTSCGAVIQSQDEDSVASLSGYFNANFEKTQWLQLQATLTPNQNNTSFVRLLEIRVR